MKYNMAFTEIKQWHSQMYSELYCNIICVEISMNWLQQGTQKLPLRPGSPPYKSSNFITGLTTSGQVCMERGQKAVCDLTAGCMAYSDEQARPLQSAGVHGSCA